MTRAPGLVFGGIEGVGSRFHLLRSRTHFRRYRGRRVPFSCFALPDSFSAVWRASGPIIMFFVSVSFSSVPRVSGPVFMFCAPKLVFDGVEGVGTHFSCFLRSRTCFRRYRGRRVLFSCFALPNSISAISRTSGPVFILCAPGLVLGGPIFHVFRARTHFHRYRGRRVAFSSFALPDSISAVPRASGPVYIFCAPRLVFGGTDGVGSRFHVLRARTHFRGVECVTSRFHFARPFSFSAVMRA
jgi:hypothetical protein